MDIIKYRENHSACRLMRFFFDRKGGFKLNSIVLYHFVVIGNRVSVVCSQLLLSSSRRFKKRKNERSLLICNDHKISLYPFSSEKAFETSMAVRLISLLFKGALLQLFQAIRADKVFRVKFFEHRSDATT